MKSKLILFAIIGFTVFSFYGCWLYDNNNSTVSGENGQKYESYQECCAAEDYQAAHLYLARMENAIGDDLDKEVEYLDAREYVFKHEALFLMSRGDETSKNRLVYLLKEEGGNNDHVAMLIDLAIENDDEAFVKKLANQYEKYASSASLKKLMDYLLEKQQNDNKDFIEKLFKRIKAEDLLLELAIKDGNKQFIDEYASNHLSLSNTTLLNYLAGTKEKRYSEMIVGLLVDEENDIPSRPALGTIKSDHYGKLDSSYDNFISSVKDYNDACLTILNVAITTKNQYLAQRVIAKAKPNIVYKNLGDWEDVVVKRGYSSVYDAFKVTTDNTEQNSIKAAYQDAVRSGAFK